MQVVKLYFNRMFPPTTVPDLSINNTLFNDIDEKAMRESSHEP